MTKLLMAGCGMKILLRERDLGIFMGGMRDTDAIQTIWINILSGAGGGI